MCKPALFVLIFIKARLVMDFILWPNSTLEQGLLSFKTSDKSCLVRNWQVKTLCIYEVFSNPLTATMTLLLLYAISVSWHQSYALQGEGWVLLSWKGFQRSI